MHSVTSVFNVILLLQIVPEWKADRKRLQPYFTKDVINYLVPEMNKSVYKVVKKMEKFVNGPEFDITDTIYDLSLDFITRELHVIIIFPVCNTKR